MFSRSLAQNRYSMNVCCTLKKYTLKTLSSAEVAGGGSLKALHALLKALQQCSEVLGAVVRDCLEIKNAEQAPGLCITATLQGRTGRQGLGTRGGEGIATWGSGNNSWSRAHFSGSSVIERGMGKVSPVERTPPVKSQRQKSVKLLHK